MARMHFTYADITYMCVVFRHAAHADSMNVFVMLRAGKLPSARLVFAHLYGKFAVIRGIHSHSITLCGTQRPMLPVHCPCAGCSSCCACCVTIVWMHN